MLEIDVLKSKNIRIIDGEQSLDIVTSSMDKQMFPIFVDYSLVTTDTEMRPDLIAHFKLGGQSRVGLLLKANSISNPFSIKYGEVLFIPTQGYLDNALSSNTDDTTKKENKSFRKKLQERISKVSEERMEYLRAKNISDAINANPLPPNVLDEGEQQIEFVDGKIVFGGDVGKCRSKLNKGTSATQLKSRLIERKIFKGS